MLSKLTRELVFSALVLTCVAVNFSNAADDVFMTGGIGGGTTGIGINCNLIYRVNTMAFTLRYIAQSEVQIIGSLSPAKSATDVSLLVGLISRKGEKVMASLDVGFGRLKTVDRGKRFGGGWFSGIYEKVEKDAIGFAFQTQVFYKIVGLNVYANLAKAGQESSFGGAALCLRFGG